MGYYKEKTLERRDARKPAVKVGGSADWGSISAESIRDAISKAGYAGGSILFGYTRDGGAYYLRYYGLGDATSAYLRPSDDVEGFLRELCECYDDVSKAGKPSVARD